MQDTGFNLERTKRANRLLALRLLCTGCASSRTELTRRMGLAKMTVTNIVSEMLQAGVVEEAAGAEDERPAGRPQTVLRLSAHAPAVLGLWIARDSCTGICATLDLGIAAQRRIPLGPHETAQSLLERLAALAGALLRESGRPVIGAGIASPGPLDAERGVLLNPPDFYGLQNVPLAEPLSQRLGLPVFVQNDMDAAALAEKLYGGCMEYGTFAYVGLTNGVGAGFILKDVLFTGAKGFAGELGHMSLDGNGPLCTCGGRGCLETYMSIPRLLAFFERSLGRGFSGFAELCRFCEADAAAGALFRSATDHLVTALANLCNLFDPQVILIGHEGAEMTDAQLRSISQRVNNRILAKGYVHIPIRRSSFGAMAPVYGGAVAVLRQIFEKGLGYDRFFQG